MSRIGKSIIHVPKEVDVRQDGDLVLVRGPKGESSMRLHPLVAMKIEEADGKKTIAFSVKHPEEKDERALWGTMQSIVENMVRGVVEPYVKQLELEGVGFKVNLSGKKLVLSIGFSHDVDFEIPAGVEVSVEKNLITIKGVDKQLVGEVASRLRALKKPEPYKGKGIHYVGEHIRRKVGKAAKAAE